MRSVTFDGTLQHLPIANRDTHARIRALVTESPNDYPILRSSAARHGVEAVSAAKKLWRQLRVAHQTWADMARARRG